METDHKDRKDAKSLKIERVFETSRLAGEFMAGAYETIIPISRVCLNTTKRAVFRHELWPQNKEQQKCTMGI